MNEHVEFFSKNDLDKYGKYAGVEYNSKNEENKKIGQIIKKKFFEKTKHWASEVEKSIHYKKNFRCTWQYGGRRFAEYTWAKLYKPRYEEKLIFFTIGINIVSQKIIIKLDCQSSQPTSSKSKLSKKEIEKFKYYINAKGIDCYEIPVEELENYTWKKLIKETVDYIKKHEKYYDEAIMYIYGKLEPQKEITYEFDNDKTKLKKKERRKEKTKQSRKTDWKKLSHERQRIGKSGEEFVLKVEKIEIKKSRKNKDKEVEHISQTRGDGEGYDILSYDKNGNKKYIEVKTTTGSRETPFYLTKNEYDVSMKKENYFIYRVYDFDFLKNFAKIKILGKNDIKKLELIPEVYKTSL